MSSKPDIRLTLAMIEARGWTRKRGVPSMVRQIARRLERIRGKAVKRGRRPA